MTWARVFSINYAVFVENYGRLSATKSIVLILGQHNSLIRVGAEHAELQAKLTIYEFFVIIIEFVCLFDHSSFSHIEPGCLLSVFYNSDLSLIFISTTVLFLNFCFR